ncbi:MAG: hypothetical protein AAAB35_04875 [Phyllobacterium sp.]
MDRAGKTDDERVDATFNLGRACAASETPNSQGHRNGGKLQYNERITLHLRAVSTALSIM